MARLSINAEHEEWRAAPGYEGLYEVSNRGNVRGLPRVSLQGRQLPLRLLALQKHPKGYRMVGLQRDGTNQKVLVHRLVCEAFHGPAPEGMTDACHIDEVKHHNTPENLKWGTRSQNIKQYADSGRYRNQFTNLTHCLKGHEYTEENTRIWRNPTRGTTHRICRTCACSRTREWRRRVDR